MHSTPRHRRSSIATHIGALVLLALWPAAVGAAGAEAEAGIAVQEVLPKLSLPAGPASAVGLNLEQRVGRIEGYLPLLATKEDLRNTEKSLRAEMKADLQATETRLEKAIEALRTDIREQLRNFLLINGAMITMLGGLLLWVVKNMLLPANLEGPVRTVMRQLKKEERRASQTKADEGAAGEDEDASRP